MKIRIDFNTEEQNIFFTSDTHFNHPNILKYCSRPFSSVEEMDEAIIENWNNVVGPEDIVFHLGDVGFKSAIRVREILDRLHGRIYLVAGNHDRKLLTDNLKTRFEFVSQQLYIRVNDQPIYLNHFPFLCFDGVYGRRDNSRTWQLFGHVHSGPRTKTGLDCQRLVNLFPTQYDVGVDNNSYTPISFDRVGEIISDQLLSQNLHRGTN